MKVILFALIAVCLSMSTMAIVIGDPSTPPPPSPSEPVSSTPTAVPIVSSVPVSTPVSTPVSDPVSVPVAPAIDAPIAAPINNPVNVPIDTPIDVPAVPVTVPVSTPVNTPVAAPIAVPVSVPVSPPITAPVAAPNPVASAYVGCFEDLPARDLPFQAYSDALNTNVRCIDTCATAGYAYAATQNGNECWCGHSYGNKGQFNDVMCNSSCLGDPTQHCGSGYKNSVYRTPQRYIGCFQDSATRDLKKTGYLGFVYNTPEKCMKVCKSAGYVYAGMQIGTACFCGNSYGSQGRLSESACNVVCSGYTNWSTIKCGGAYINSVYRV